MSRRKNPVPSYSLHKPSGRAFARFTDATGNRRTVYLGRYGSPESREEYERLLLGLRTSPGVEPAKALAPVAATTLAEAMLRYAGHVNSYSPADTTRCHTDALRQVRVLSASLTLREFTPKVFKQVRPLIVVRLSPASINGRTQNVAQFARWAVSEELVEPAVFQALKAVPGLRRGRGEVRENPPVRPPAEGDLEKVLAALPPAATALARVSSPCGAWAGELVGLNGAAVVRDGPVWRAAIRDHKGQ